jgi:hypothetical protein
MASNTRQNSSSTPASVAVEKESDLLTVAHATKKVSFPTATAMRAHIFNTPDRREELVEVPEWGVTVLVKGLTAKVRNQIVQAAQRPDGSTDIVKITPDLVIYSVYNPADPDTLVFSPADRDALNEKNGGALERLALVATRLSAMDGASREDLRKN